jgi:CheY-like chemotaxis protein
MSLPIYQHPSMTVLVDDSATFLRSLQFQLPPTLPSTTFNDVVAALAWIRLQSEHAERPETFFSPNMDTYPRSAQPCNIELHLDQVCRISRRPLRFMAPSVLVVDYSMPQMNGIRFCEAVADLPCKKILLTGVADESLAVDAFNRGLIHRYIRKSDDDALDKLENAIVSLQQDYFVSQSEALRSLFSLHEYRFVSDPAIAALVRDLRASYRIVEYYLHQQPTGFLMYDAQGRPYLLVIETEQSMIAHFEVACDNNAPLGLLSALEERQIIPNFMAGDGMYSAPFGTDWRRYSAPAQVCQGRERYYWAMFELATERLREPVAPFSQFLDKHRP